MSNDAARAKAEGLLAETAICLPATTINIGDLMDRGMDKLRTVWLASCPDSAGWMDEGGRLAVWSTLDAAIRDLEPVRNLLQGVKGGAA